MSFGESPPPGVPGVPGGPAPEPAASSPQVDPPPTTDPAPTSTFAWGGKSEWPAQAADLVVEVVGKVRDSTATPLLTIARGVVYGTAIVFLAITLITLFIVALVRFLDLWLPGEVWLVYLLLGTICMGGGLFLWATRRPSAA